MGKIWGWLVIIGLAGLAYWWQPAFFQHSYSIIEHGDIEALAEYLRSFGTSGILVTIILFVIMTFTIVFPFMILSGAAGIVYGLFWGIIISWAGEFIGAVVAFVLVRYFFRNSVEGWIAKSRYLKQVDDYSATNGFSALLIARLLPLAPSGIITAVAAISRISVRDFLLATLIGKLPPVVIKVLIGHDIVYLGQHGYRLIALVLGVIAIYGWLWWRKRKKRN
ncbi:MAG: associated protein [Firmicutes bacterium]|nr:associated protein [Bacillota bacterium]